MKHAAVIFDLDGTLLDTIGDIADAMNCALTEAGFPARSDADYACLIGNGLTDLVERALPPAARERGNVDRVLNTMRRVYQLRMTVRTRPFEGVPMLLDGLVARGIKLAVLSNKPDPMTKEIVRIVLRKWAIDPVLGSTPLLPKKPDPASALELATRLDIPPGNIALVGDSVIDMKTALAAGMTAYGVGWGYGRTEEMMLSGVRGIARDPGDLLDMLLAP
jgi:phosphoglycolate phosphatase